MTPILKRLTRRIFNISNRLKEFGGFNGNEFVIHCRKSLANILDASFKIGDYSYEVVIDDELPERQGNEGWYESDIWIVPKENP